MIPKKIDVSFPVAITTVTTFYAVAPCRCTITDIKLACSIDPGDDETFTVTVGGTSIGVVDMGTAIAAGDIGTYTADATTGETVIEAGAAIKFVTTSMTAASHFTGYVEVDQYARTTE